MVACVALAACRDGGSHGAAALASAPPTSAPNATTETPAATTTPSSPRLEGNWIERIDIPQSYALVTPPIGATERRPIVVSVHGAMDDPGWQCSAWRLIVDAYPFVVCPAGTKASGTLHAWSSDAQLETRVLAAVAAVKARWPSYVSDAPLVYVAFSQGATMAGPLLQKHAERIPRAVLTEGGWHVFENATLLRTWATDGGATTRVLLTCSLPGCASGFDASKRGLARAGIDAHVVYAGSFGHTMAPGVRRSIHAEWPWFVAGLAGWETYAAAPKLAEH